MFKKYIWFFLFLNSIFGFNLNSFRQIDCNNRKIKPNSKTFLIDIDDTICVAKDGDYRNSIPLYKYIKTFNNLYDKGNEVHYWTARGINSDINWDDLTIRQLKLWNVKYSTLNMGKPHYDVWIDDKALNVRDIIFVNDIDLN